MFIHGWGTGHSRGDIRDPAEPSAGTRSRATALLADTPRFVDPTDREFPQDVFQREFEQAIRLLMSTVSSKAIRRIFAVKVSQFPPEFLRASMPPHEQAGIWTAFEGERTYICAC
jgi:hypothetical protein